jgi:hypothetical protein
METQRPHHLHRSQPHGEGEGHRRRGRDPDRGANAFGGHSRANRAQPLEEAGARSPRLLERFDGNAEGFRASEEVRLASPDRIDAHGNFAIAVLEQAEEDFGVAEHHAIRKDEPDAASAIRGDGFAQRPS